MMKKRVQAEAEQDVQTPSTLKRKTYRQELAQLQVNLVKLQEWIAGQNGRLVVIFESLGPAGKRATVRRIAEGLNRRLCKVVTFAPPTKREQGQWYFKRYVEQFPVTDQIALMDGSWYHYPAIERTLGLYDADKFEDFLNACATFERALVDSEVILVKYWFGAGAQEQDRRFHEHVEEPIQQRRLHLLEKPPAGGAIPVDQVRDAILTHTNLAGAPWYLVDATDRRRARLNCMSHLISLAANESAGPTGSKSPESPGAALETVAGKIGAFVPTVY